MTDKIIKDFLKEMATQNNRHTAFPYFYVILDRKKVSAQEGYEDGADYFLTEDSETAISSDNYNNLSEEKKEDYTAWNYQWIETESGMFLTEKDAKEHLSRNNYHYSDWAHTYVKHAWRADYLEEFFKALFKHFNIGNRLIRDEKPKLVSVKCRFCDGRGKNGKHRCEECDGKGWQNKKVEDSK